jgi:hypothetical protein
MRSACDRTGFPLIEIPEAGLEAHLLPVTKLQFERFLAEPNEFGDHWYATVLAVHERVSWRHFTDEDRERLFLGAVLPAEAAAFAAWMGPGFGLPSVQEWRGVYGSLRSEILTSAKLAALRSKICAAAWTVVERLLDQLHPRSLFDLSLMNGGMVEWARQDKTHVGLGAPRPEFCPNLWDPRAEVVRPLRPAERLGHFGFRLVKRGR